MPLWGAMMPRCRKMKFALSAVVLSRDENAMLPGPECTLNNWRQVEGEKWPIRWASGRVEARGSGGI